MLRMDVDKHHRQFPELADSHRSIVDEGTRAACRCKLAAQYALRVVPVYIVGLAKPPRRIHVGSLECRFDDTLGILVADSATVSTGTENQRQRTEHDALARAGLAGDDVHARTESDIYIVNESVIGYM